VDELGIHFRVVSRRRTPRDSQFNIVVLERDQWNRGLSVFAKRKFEWVEVLVVKLILGVRLTRGNWRECSNKLISLVINDLTTDQKFNFGDFVSPIGDIRTSVRDVDISEHITFTLESNGRHTISDWVALDNLSFNSLGEICVTFVVRSKKGNFGLTDKVRILGTNSNELGYTSRHILYYTKVFYF
jgi:hypothetical protein